MNDRKHLEVNLTLEGEIAKRFQYVKRALRLKSNASVLKQVLIEAYERIEKQDAKQN